MYYIRKQTKGLQWPVDKFYYADNVDWGHFIVIKGYKIVDKHVLFEVYDPASSMTYPNGTYMGKDRLYRAEDLMNSADIWRKGGKPRMHEWKVLFVCSWLLKYIIKMY
jgi:hypothetical protein